MIILTTVNGRNRYQFRGFSFPKVKEKYKNKYESCSRCFQLLDIACIKLPKKYQEKWIHPQTQKEKLTNFHESFYYLNCLNCNLKTNVKYVTATYCENKHLWVSKIRNFSPIPPVCEYAIRSEHYGPNGEMIKDPFADRPVDMHIDHGICDICNQKAVGYGIIEYEKNIPIKEDIYVDTKSVSLKLKREQIAFLYARAEICKKCFMYHLPKKCFK